MMTDTSVLNDYIDKVYGYAINKTYSRDEADELAQEILFTAVKELSKLRNPDRFEAWLWGIADNVTKVFRRKMGKQRAMYSYDTLEYVEVTDEYTFEDEEIYENLREKISKLSKLYREIIIMYYYDSLSVKQISDKLQVPEGTVTWRLSEARNKLKKECTNMTETALRPEITEMSISISGNGNYDGKEIPFPETFINDALSKSIIYHCYKEPKNIEELAKLCGVPAYFIEDTVNRLIYREAITEPVKGKYQTCFIIYNEDHQRYNENAENLAMPIVDEFADLIKIFTQKVIDTGVYTAGKSVNELCYLFGVLAFTYMSDKYNTYLPVPYKVKYDSNDWNYHAHMKGCGSGGMGVQRSLNRGSGGTYAHYVYSFGGFTFKRMMYDCYINVCEKLLNGDELSSRDKDYAADMVINGYISNIDGKLHVNTPALTFLQKAEFDRLADECFTDFMPKYTAFVDKYISGYKKLFPKHVQEDVDRKANYLWIGLFSNVVSAAQKKGLLDKPQSDSICDVIVQHKELSTLS